MTFRRRYNLPPTDPRFLDATEEEIVTDYWIHFYRENGLKDEQEDPDFDLDAEIARMADDDWEEVKS